MATLQPRTISYDSTSSQASSCGGSFRNSQYDAEDKDYSSLESNSSCSSSSSDSSTSSDESNQTELARKFVDDMQSSVQVTHLSPEDSDKEKSESVDKSRRFHSFKNLYFFFFRLLTFQGWPVEFIKPSDCAATGLFYLHKDDLVQCVYCRGVIGYWEEGDIPSVEHEKHFPLCPMVQDALHTNITNDKQKLVETMKKKIEVEDPPHHKSVAMSADRSAEGPTSYHFPELHDRTKRRQTYVQHTENMPPIDKLVDAGFFYIGLSDMTQCYACGGGVMNWKEKEDPKQVHDTLYPRCPLITGTKMSKEEVRLNELPVDEGLMLDLPLAKRLLNMGYPKKLVGEAFLDHFKQYGTLANTLPESMDIVSDYQERLYEMANQ